MPLTDGKPWWREFWANVRNARSEVRLPEGLTSTPIVVPDPWGLYKFNKKSALLSTLLHVGFWALLSVVSISVPIVRGITRDYMVIYLPADIIAAAKPRPVQHTKLATKNAGGGGGYSEPLPVSRGRLPKPVPRAFVPPIVAEERITAPKLPVMSEIEAPPVTLASADRQYGDPWAKQGPLSWGQGSGGGIGQGKGLGVGNGTGSGYISGSGGKIGGMRKSPTGGIRGAALIRKVEPAYTVEARAARWTGTILLYCTIGTDGHVSNIRVVRNPCPYPGMVRNAIMAAQGWLFQPAVNHRDGQPVPQDLQIEVEFVLH